MSYAHTKRRKVLKLYKKKFGKKLFYEMYRKMVDDFETSKRGTPIGTLADICPTPTPPSSSC